MASIPRARRSGHVSVGFSMIEAVVAAALSVGVCAVALVLLQSTARTTDTQRELADLQQGLRIARHEIARHIRMTGAAGFGIRTESRPGRAIEVLDHLSEGTFPIAVASGTDVLILRGVFSSPLLGIDESPGADLRFLDSSGLPVNDPELARSGLFNVSSAGPDGSSQDLSALVGAIERDLPEALLVTSGGADAGVVVELDAERSTVTPVAGGLRIEVAFVLSGGRFSSSYEALSGPRACLRRAQWLGLLEEIAFYVREVEEGGITRRALARARMYPGTGTPHLDRWSEARVLVAEGVSNLQVALGFSAGDQGPVDALILESPDGAGDGWLFNSVDDEPAEPPGGSDGSTPMYLELVRFSLWGFGPGNRAPGRLVRAENFGPAPAEGTPRYLQELAAPRSSR